MTAQALAGAFAGITLVLVAVVLALLARLRRGGLEDLLVGKTVVVNTPKPDDQSFRGVVREELATGELVLGAAIYYERRWGRGGQEVAAEVVVGDVVVRGPKLGAWIQVLYPATAQEG